MDKRSEAQKLKPLVNDRHAWGLLTDYLAVEKDRLVTLLINCDEKEMRMIQGSIKAIQRIINIPDNLKTEENTRKR